MNDRYVINKILFEDYLEVVKCWDYANISPVVNALNQKDGFMLIFGILDSIELKYIIILQNII